MDKDTRNAIERATQRARRLLEDDFISQLEGTYDVLRTGEVAAEGGPHLSPRQRVVREKIVAAVEHKRAAGEKPGEAVAGYARDAAFTALNRFVALKMLEARGQLQECVTKGELSSGYKEFCGLAPGVALLPEGAGYRIYVECLFDELSTEIKVLFDRRDPASALWPKRATFEELLAVLNAPELAGVWGEDETIGWVYQFFNSGDERRAMREESQAPRNSRELAVRNQFFTPRYVVRFLTENTLGRTWIEMMGEKTRLAERCEFLVTGVESRGPRAKKDPRDIRILDPACGSGHFLLYAFDLLLPIYEEAWADPDAAPRAVTGRKLRQDYPDLGALRRAAPGLILAENLHGVDIDPRCAQIAALALWLRAQRAFQEFGVKPSERPCIARTHIVVAEPMPGDAALVEAFAKDLHPPLLGDLFRKMVAEMRLAGELGSLIRVDKGIGEELERARQQWNRDREPGDLLPGLDEYRVQAALDLSHIDDARFFEEAEALLLAALKRFAESAAGGAGVRRRLFAGDAVQGIALIDLLRKKFDLVLMNPPFGDATANTETYLEAEWYETRLDLFATFVERGLSLAEAGGLLGAITPRDGMFKKTLLGFRDLILRSHLDLLADLGIGVLDATVRVAAYVVGNGTSAALSCFIDVVDLPDRDLRLCRPLLGEQKIFLVKTTSFRALPLHRFLYWIPERLSNLFETCEPLENKACTPRYGLTTLNDERFTRLSFEVDPASIGRSHAWVFMSKGGDDFPYGGVSNAVVRWKHDAAEMAEVNRQANGQVAQTRRASKYYFQPAVAFSNRSVQFAVRWHPANFAFSMRGPVVIPLSASQAYLLGFFNSRPIRALVEMQTASQTYTTGVLKELRWIEPDEHSRSTVEKAALEAFAQVRTCLETVETDPVFRGIFPAQHPGLRRSARAYFSWRQTCARVLNENLINLQGLIDRTIAALYGVTVSDMEKCERTEAEAESQISFPPPFSFGAPDAEALVSFLVGVAFGRWTGATAEGSTALNDVVPKMPPAQREFDHTVSYPDDPGHPSDIINRIHEIFPRVLPDAEDLLLIEGELGVDLREWLAQSFFSRHLSDYSGFGRKAPIYWQLGTPSASYSVWLYAHRLTPDSFFHLLHEMVAPKLALEQRKLVSLNQEHGPNPTPSQRKANAAQEALVEDLTVFRDEVARVAPVWKPNLDDGILLTMAPLWRLVPQHRAWQKELRSAWASLCEGEYDWAHVAMHLWPERVVPKCAADRSLAIAHGLEEVFWEEGANGRWRQRREPLRPAEELVRERTSAAVKAALADLLGAPMPTGKGRASRRISGDNGERV